MGFTNSQRPFFLMNFKAAATVEMSMGRADVRRDRFKAIRDAFKVVRVGPRAIH